MKVEKKQLDKVQVELTIEIPEDEFKEFVERHIVIVRVKSISQVSVRATLLAN